MAKTGETDEHGYPPGYDFWTKVEITQFDLEYAIWNLSFMEDFSELGHDELATLIHQHIIEQRLNSP